MDIDFPAYNVGQYLTGGNLDRVKRVYYQADRFLRRNARRTDTGSIQSSLQQKIGSVKGVTQSEMPNFARKKVTVKRTRRGGGNYSAATFYQGKNKGVVRRNSARRGSVFDITGYRKEYEQHGQVLTTGGTQTLRLGVKAYQSDDMIIAIFISILRYLLKKHYAYQYSSSDDYINSNNVLTPNQIGRPAQWDISFRSTIGVGGNYQYGFLSADISGTSTLKSVATEIAYKYNIMPSTSGIEKPDWTLFQYRFNDIYRDSTGVVSGEQHTWLPFAGIKISLYGKAEVNIQNTTRADHNTNFEMDLIDNNPLCGNICYVKGQTPVPQSSGVQTNPVDGDIGMGFNPAGNKDGVLFQESALTTRWRAVQPLSMFRRGIKQQSINLDPGACKSYTVFFKYNGLATTFFQKYWPDSYQDGAVTTAPRHVGSDQGFGGLNQIALLQLEKRIATGTSTIIINYHVDFHLGCRVTRGPTTTRWTVDFGEANVNKTYPAPTSLLEKGNEEEPVEDV